MSKFKINDIVVKKSDPHGQKGIIKDSFRNGYLVLWDNLDAEIVLGKDLGKLKFVIGDRIVLTKGFHKGKLGTIVKYNENGSYAIKLDIFEFPVNFWGDEFQKD